MRLIDADALRDEWPEPIDWMDREQVLCHITWFRAVIDNMPTIDPVKHGRWMLSENQREEEVANDNYQYICSCCGKADLHAKSQEVPYCWWCGARMKGEEG